MEEHIQEAVTDDFFDAVPVGDGVAVRMSDNVAHTLAQLVDRLIQFLDTGDTGAEHRGLFRPAASSDKVLRRMFPDAYRDRVQARDFRDRHAAELRDTAAPRRVHYRCANDTAHILPYTEVDDWLVTMGLARFLDLPRTGAAPGMTGTWLSYVQECLILAVNPRLAD